MDYLKKKSAPPKTNKIKGFKKWAEITEIRANKLALKKTWKPQVSISHEYGPKLLRTRMLQCLQTIGSFQNRAPGSPGQCQRGRRRAPWKRSSPLEELCGAGLPRMLRARGLIGAAAGRVRRTRWVPGRGRPGPAEVPASEAWEAEEAAGCRFWSWPQGVPPGH